MSAGQRYRDRERGGPPPPPDDDYQPTVGSFQQNSTGFKAPSFSGKQAKEFFDGDYIGELVGDKKHGRGIMRYKNGTEYEGQWSNDLRHGNGVFRWPEGARYEGQFVGGAMGGESSGTYFTADGKKCEATWVSAPATNSSRGGGGYQ